MSSTLQPAPARVIIPMDVFVRLSLGLKAMAEHLNRATRNLPSEAERLPDETLHELECLAGHMGDMEQLFRICFEESR